MAEPSLPAAGAGMPASTAFAARKALSGISFYAAAILISVGMFLPFFWSLITSFKPSDEFSPSRSNGFLPA
ncbi:hypothetical protein [Paenibacillus humicus]|uniref:hypothetical protein n=1 Tax=Paenibacillus humicus TaxID=412861 RepID=UPI003F5CDB55